MGNFILAANFEDDRRVGHYKCVKCEKKFFRKKIDKMIYCPFCDNEFKDKSGELIEEVKVIDLIKYDSPFYYGKNMINPFRELSRSAPPDAAYTILRKNRDKVYFFDENGIYCSKNIKEIKTIDSDMRAEYYVGRSAIDGMYIMEEHYPEPKVDQVEKKMALRKMKLGETREHFQQLLLTTKKQRREKPTGLDRFITSMARPIIERETDNENKNTFDFIRMYIGILSEEACEENRIEYIKQNQPVIVAKAISAIKDSKQFIKYNIPIDYLKLSQMTITKDDQLLFLFELKTGKE